MTHLHRPSCRRNFPFPPKSAAVQRLDVDLAPRDERIGCQFLGTTLSKHDPGGNQMGWGEHEN